MAHRDFHFENRGYAVRTTAPPRKKSRLLRLLPCKRGRREFRGCETRPSKSNANETWLVGSAALTTFCGKGQGRSFFSAACSFRTKSRRAKPRGIFLVLTSQVALRATYSVKKPWRAFCARVILAPARLTRPRTAWKFAKLPFHLRETAVLAAYSHPSLKIPAGAAQRNFPVLPGHGPRSG